MQPNPPFTLIIPGLPPLTNFEYTNGFFHTDVNNPATIQYMTLVLISQLPDNTALSLHYSLPPYSSMNYMGAITNGRPTDTFSTGWGIDQSISSLVPQTIIDPTTGQQSQNTTIKICIKPDTF
jgi:hypothetical protein